MDASRPGNAWPRLLPYHLSLFSLRHHDRRSSSHRAAGAGGRDAPEDGLAGHRAESAAAGLCVGEHGERLRPGLGHHVTPPGGDPGRRNLRAVAVSGSAPARTLRPGRRLVAATVCAAGAACDAVGSDALGCRCRPDPGRHRIHGLLLRRLPRISPRGVSDRVARVDGRWLAVENAHANYPVDPARCGSDDDPADRDRRVDRRNRRGKRGAGHHDIRPNAPERAHGHLDRRSAVRCVSVAACADLGRDAESTRSPRRRGRRMDRRRVRGRRRSLVMAGCSARRAPRGT